MNQRWIVVIPVLLSVVGCASTHVTSQADPTLTDRSYERFLAHTDIQDIGLRQVAEDRLCEELTDRGCACLPAYSFFFPGREYSEKEVASMLRGAGVHGVVLVAVSDAGDQPFASTDQTYGDVWADTRLPSGSATTSTGVGDAFSTSQTTFAAQVWDPKQSKAVWVASASADGPVNLSSLRSLASQIVSQLDTDDVLTARSGESTFADVEARALSGEMDKPRRRSSTSIASVYAFMGYGTQTQDDVNGVIDDSRQQVEDAGGTAESGTFDGALEFGGGGAFRIMPAIAFGAEVGYQSSSVSNEFSDAVSSVSETVSLSIVDVTGLFQVFIPGTPGLSLGANVGYGFGKAKDEILLVDLNDSSNNLQATGEFTGSGVVYGGFAEYRRDAGNSGMFFLRGGYRGRNLGSFETDDGQTAQDNAGDAIDFDYSGVYARAGIGLRLGK